MEITKKYWVVETNKGGHIRIEYDGSCKFNLQIPSNGEWGHFHSFTCYGLDTAQQALENAFGTTNENVDLVKKEESKID